MSAISDKEEQHKLPPQEFERIHVSNLSKGTEGDHRILTKAHHSQLGSVQPIEAMRMSVMTKPEFIRRHYADQLTKRSIDFQML